MAASRRIDAILLGVAAVWGSSYLAAKVATAATPVLTVLFARYSLSLLVCVPLVLAMPRGSRITKDEWRAGGLLGVTQAMVLVLETFGVAHSSAANAGLIISLTIVLTPMLDRSTAGPALPGGYFAAAALSVLGVLMLVSSGSFHAPGLGDGLMLAAAVVRAGHVVLIGRITRARTVRPLPLTTVQTLTGTGLFAVAAAWQLPALAHLDATDWAVLAYLALFCSVFAFLAQTWAIKHTSASRTSLLLGTEPVWAVAAGVVLGGERLTVVAGAGAALVIGGCYWGQLVEQRHRVASREAVPSR